MQTNKKCYSEWSCTQIILQVYRNTYRWIPRSGNAASKGTHMPLHSFLFYFIYFYACLPFWNSSSDFPSYLSGCSGFFSCFLKSLRTAVYSGWLFKVWPFAVHPLVSRVVPQGFGHWSSFILYPLSQLFSSLKAIKVIISGFYASKVWLCICMQIYNIYACVCINMNIHVYKTFSPFLALLPQIEAVLKRSLQAATITVAQNIFNLSAWHLE